MLERLLERITKDRAVSAAEMATELDTSPELVESMLEQLERLGYLEAIPGCTSGVCAGCSGQTVCRPVRVWMLGKRMKKPKIGAD